MRMFVFIIILAQWYTMTIGVKAQESNQEYVPSRSLIEDFDKPLGAARESDARPLPRVATELIKTFEGWSAWSYNDPVGYCTIGFGHLIALKRCEHIDLSAILQPLSARSGEALLIRDTVSARLIIADLVDSNLSEDQFGALASLVFNIGKGNFAKSTILKLINAGAYEEASDQFLRWTRAKGRILPGLVARRACEQALFVGFAKLKPNGRFDREACQTLGVAPDGVKAIDIEAGEN